MDAVKQICCCKNAPWEHNCWCSLATATDLKRYQKQAVLENFAAGRQLDYKPWYLKEMEERINAIDFHPAPVEVR